jgi:CyaY protein
MVDEAEYVSLAQRELKSLVEALDQLANDALDCELENDILTLEFSDETTYVINSHRAAKQIWMAADLTAWHFDWDTTQQRWVATKTGDELWETVSRVVTKKLRMPIVLSPGDVAR